MSTPQTVEDVFKDIDKELHGIIEYFDDMDIYIAWITKKIEEAKIRYPFMQDATEEGFNVWGLREDAIKIKSSNQNQNLPPPTDKEFWKAAYQYDPLGPNPPSVTDLQRIICSGRAAPYTIGKLYGRQTLKLIPAIGALPSAPILEPGWQAPFHFAPTDSAAIYYPDGHPSGTWQPRQPAATFTPNPTVYTATARDDDKLRRFAALGWVIMENSEGEWEKTGHVLVMDMDDRAVRHRHPWLILASEWPTDGEETEDGGFMIHAEEEVIRGDSIQSGVFPGDNNRTPICRLLPLNRDLNDGEILLQSLGEGFDFKPERKGGHRLHRDTAKGPDLARVMEWYWDDKAKQEVCYTKNGEEYMRYDPRSKTYFFRDFSSLGLEEEQGLHGELYGPPIVEVLPRPTIDVNAYQQRLRAVGWGQALMANPRRHVSANIGF
ncbi:MAG: hypothetical protein LQ346_000587 [Caloplaca aetnensis]|nr:MAG: hypothetical protein LQ346_000587 [Caloplaca aetnensis]